MSQEPLVHDWNPASRPDHRSAAASVVLLDETLRDGLQSPSVRQPSLDEKAELLGLMDKLGVGVAKIGMPSVSRRLREDCLALARFASHGGLSLGLACAARALPEDVLQVADVVQKAGRAVEAYVFIATSALRARTEGWSDETVRGLLATALETARREGLSVTFVAEDATRTHPDTLREVLRVAIHEGAQRVCLCDTTGSATPGGAEKLVSFAAAVAEEAGASIGIDWHGHDDRGLALASTLAAASAGADRLHATALGVGERAGNVAMESLVMNLVIAGVSNARPSELDAYCRAASRALGVEISHDHPVVGRDAFRTAAGTHAAAIAKADAQGEAWVADRIYSAFPASWVGQRHAVEIGALSGERAVSFWLAQHGVEPTEGLVAAVLAAAKASERILSESDVWALVRRHRSSERSGVPDSS